MTAEFGDMKVIGDLTKEIVSEVVWLEWVRERMGREAVDTATTENSPGVVLL